ncbi:MAG: hypothetical protein E4H08_10830, partial [Candidatus Atribacteria bacterium]
MKCIHLREFVGIILAVTLLAIAVGAQTNTSAPAPEDQSERAPYFVELDRLAALMAQILDPFLETYYAAAQGCNAETQDELAVHAQVVLNMVEGSSSTLFDDSIEIPLYTMIGLRPIVDSFEFTSGWFDPAVTSLSQRTQLENTYETIGGILWNASMRLQQIQAEGASLSDMRESMTMVCRLFDGLKVLLEGSLAELGYLIWCRADSVIQDVIDGAREGATIYLWPTTYVGSLEISKSITIDGSHLDSRPPFVMSSTFYRTAIEADESGVGIRICADHPVQVTIRQVTIKNASEAIVAEGQVLVTLDQVSVIDSDVGIAGYDLAQITISDSSIEHNGTALRLDDASSMT